MFKKGHKFSKETKIKISNTLKGRSVPKKVRKKISKTLKGKKPWNTGKKMSKKIKLKMSNSAKKKDGHHAWSGGSKRYWNNKVFNRDDWTCQVCGLKDLRIMHVDHIKPKSKFPELIKDIDNMQTICPNCHARKTLDDFKKFKLGKPKKKI